MGKGKVPEDLNDRYFRMHFARLVKKHGAKWIVLTNGELVGIGPERDVARLIAKARSKQPRSIPFAAPIPAQQDLQCLL